VNVDCSACLSLEEADRKVEDLLGSFTVTIPLELFRELMENGRARDRKSPFGIPSPADDRDDFGILKPGALTRIPGTLQPIGRAGAQWEGLGQEPADPTTPIEPWICPRCNIEKQRPEISNREFCELCTAELAAIPIDNKEWCKTCGKTFEPDRANPDLCEACRPAVTAAVYICPRCLTELPQAPPEGNYCEKCSAEIEAGIGAPPTKTCLQCGQEFTPLTANAVACSPACSEALAEAAAAKLRNTKRPSLTDLRANWPAGVVDFRKIEENEDPNGGVKKAAQEMARRLLSNGYSHTETVQWTGLYSTQVTHIQRELRRTGVLA
jgi:hypothetical protein